MNDYIYQQLATQRAEALRAEATADRIGRGVLARRAERKAAKAAAEEAYRARRALRAA